MTTIVKHRRTGNEYVLLGINGEVNKANPSRFISELFNQEKSDLSYSATLCDVRGNMFLAYIDDLIVVEIDGVQLADILPPANDEPDFATSESDDFDDDDFELEEERPPIVAKPSASNASAESLDAPAPEKDEDEDWI